MIKIVEILDQIENDQGGNTNNDKSHISFWKTIREQKQSSKSNNYKDKSGEVANKVTKTYNNGSQYIGEVNDDKDHHGQGTLILASGDKYEGEFKDDRMHGKGTYTFGPNSKWAGDQYEGGYKDGKQHGQGTLTFGSSSERAGEQVKEIWENGRLIKKL